MSALLKFIVALGVEGVLAALVIAGIALYKALQSRAKSKQVGVIGDRAVDGRRR